MIPVKLDIHLFSSGTTTVAGTVPAGSGTPGTYIKFRILGHQNTAIMENRLPANTSFLKMMVNGTGKSDLRNGTGNRYLKFCSFTEERYFPLSIFF